MLQDYEIVVYPNINQFKEKIQEMINSGWEPIGSLQISGEFFIREMIRNNCAAPHIWD